jgi:hypothetical protein
MGSFEAISSLLTLIRGRVYPFLVIGSADSELNGRDSGDRRAARKSKPILGRSIFHFLTRRTSADIIAPDFVSVKENPNR